MKASTIAFMGTAAQFLLFILSIITLFDGQMLGVVVFLVSLVIDLCLPFKTSSPINVSIKVFLLVQSLAIWLFLTSMESPLATTPMMPKTHFRSQRSNNIQISPIDTTTEVIPDDLSDMITRLDSDTRRAFLRIFGYESNLPPPIDAPDLKYRSSKEVRHRLATVFDDLPPRGFLSGTKNPCWYDNTGDSISFDSIASISSRRGSIKSSSGSSSGSRSDELVCLPYAYILGQPKCGTSDLFERLTRHPDVAGPRRKEVRWLTRGEFSDRPLPLEMEDRLGLPHGGDGTRLSNHTRLSSFTRSFAAAVPAIRARPTDVITVDGGPHTLWWSTQQPDGSVDPEDVPPAQILRELQPHALLLLTLADPVVRTYRDYYFLNDDRTVSRGPLAGRFKSAQQLHQRLTEQVASFRECVYRESATILLQQSESYERLGNRSVVSAANAIWFRASQICAFDRHTYGRAGWGRLSAGLYVLFLAAWLEHFSIRQVLVLRLEDYDSDPRGYLRRVFQFLGLREPEEAEWESVLTQGHFNHYRQPREAMLPETEKLLRAFFRPYNDNLAKLLDDPRYNWLDGNSSVALGREDKSSSDGDNGGGIPSLAAKRELEVRDHRHVPALPPQFPSSAEHRMSAERPPSIQGVKPRPLPDPLPRHITDEVDEPVLWIPANFTTDDLPQGSPTMQSWLQKHINPTVAPRTLREAGRQLALAAFAMDIPALRFLLLEVGVPPDVVNFDDNMRSAISSLSMLGTLAEGHSKSQVFSLLKGQRTWVSDLLDPPLPDQQHSVHALDILDSLDTAVKAAAAWLIRSGANLTAADSLGYRAVEYASYGGLLGLVKILAAAAGETINEQLRPDGRTALHWAVSQGRVLVARALVTHGADIHLKDKWNVSAYDILSAPGVVTASDALLHFNVTQRSVRRIDRVKQPELLNQSRPDPAQYFNSPSDELPNSESHHRYRAALRDYYRGWPAGSGGWGLERLRGHEDDFHCDVDQYWADEVTADVVFDYMARNAPMLIRGLIHEWPAVREFNKATLNATRGGYHVQVSDIPYYQKFGGAGGEDMLLSEYIDEVVQHRLLGGVHPWYVFRGHPVPSASDSKCGSFVPIDICPTPPMIQQSFERASSLERNISDLTPVIERSLFVNAQWAFGGEGTGAPVHYHNTAWNALVYGAKSWVVYTPQDQVMSNRQILHYLETDAKNFSTRELRGEGRNIIPITCVQTAGDVMIIPEGWGHGVLNLQEAVAIATEAKEPLWRLKPSGRLLSLLPFDNRPITHDVKQKEQNQHLQENQHQPRIGKFP